MILTAGSVLARIGVGACGLPILAGCIFAPTEPANHGQAGIIVYETGQVIAVLSMCDSYTADRFTLNAGTPGGHSDKIVREWTPKEPLEHTSTVNLLGRADESIWRSSKGQLSALDATKRYRFQGWEHESGTVAGRVYFTARDLRDLGPAEVWLGSYTDDDGHHANVVDRQEFSEGHCD